MNKINFHLTSNNSPVNWDEVFKNPQPVLMECFQTGTVTINKRGTLNPNHPRTRDVKSENLEVPILVYRINHKERGDYLLDAGLDASYYQDPHGGMGPVSDKFHQDKNHNIGFYIHERKIQLKAVFLSHLHSDHMAGVRELANDIPFIIGKGEWDEYNPTVHGDFLKDVKVLFEIDFLKYDEITPLGPSVDLMGDGSLWAIWTPGHTPGHMSFLVNGMGGPVLLTMDAAFIHENLEQVVASSDYTWDVDMAQKTLEKIVKFLKEYPQVRVGPGHEVLE